MLARSVALARPSARKSVRTSGALLAAAGRAAERVAAAAPAGRALATAASAPVTKLKIVFGSQTGTAQCFATQLASNADGAGITAEAVDAYDLKAPAASAAAIAAVKNDPGAALALVLSCFGRGEPTDSAKAFVAWLADPARDSEKDKFAGLRYAVFGLGR